MTDWLRPRWSVRPSAAAACWRALLRVRLSRATAAFPGRRFLLVEGVAGLRRFRNARFRTREVRALAAGLCLAVLLVLANALTRQEQVTVAFAKPALPSVAWEERVAAFGDKLGLAFGLKRGRAQEFAGWILEAADRQRLEPELIASLVRVESSFRKQARSHAGGVGPAQVKPGYWTEFCGGDDLSDPRFNIHCGAQVLAHLKELCGGGECALAAYNIGRNSSRIQAGERYVSKVDYHFRHLKTL